MMTRCCKAFFFTIFLNMILNMPVIASNGFLTAKSFAVGKHPYTLALGDFNSDGKADVATANLDPGSSNQTISVALGNGNGTFQKSQDFSSSSSIVVGLALGDFNADG